jgi:hypothetical protein
VSGPHAGGDQWQDQLAARRFGSAAPGVYALKVLFCNAFHVIKRHVKKRFSRWILEPLAKPSEQWGSRDTAIIGDSPEDEICSSTTGEHKCLL